MRVSEIPRIPVFVIFCLAIPQFPAPVYIKVHIQKSNYCEFTHCPVSEFAQKHDLPEVMPALCDPDCTAMELIHARLVQTIYTNSDRCDYAIYRNRNHPEYKNEAGYRRNR